MPITRADLEHLCRLAHLSLTPEELEEMQPQVSRVIDHIASLQQVATADVPPTAYAVSTDTVLREDEVRPCWSPEAILANAPRPVDDLFAVQAIFD
jgi:aspartyl-tRNA(Asn)/glutamyl-tRNA(Gln) amidotransferase subunit C